MTRHALVLLMLLTVGSTDPEAFVAAARRGDEHAVRRALKESPELVNVTDALGLTALDWAATRRHWVIFRELLEAGAAVSRPRIRHGGVERGNGPDR